VNTIGLFEILSVEYPNSDLEFRGSQMDSGVEIDLESSDCSCYSCVEGRGRIELGIANSKKIQAFKKEFVLE